VKYSLVTSLCIVLLMALSVTSKLSMAAEGIATDHSYLGQTRVIRKAQKNITIKQRKQQSIVHETLPASKPDVEHVQVLDKTVKPSRQAGVAKAPMRTETLASEDVWQGHVNTTLWALYAAGKFSALQALIRDTKKSHKDWHEPKQLLELMRLVQADKTLFQAQEDGDFKVALHQYAISPESFACDRLGWVLFLAEAQAHTGAQKQALLTYQGVMKTCSEQEKISALEHAQGVLLVQLWQPLVEHEYKKKYKGMSKERLDKLWYKLQLQKIQYASDHGQRKVVVELSDKIQGNVVVYDDAGGAEVLAWAYLRIKLFKKAMKNFVFSYRRTENPDMLRGQALAQASLGNIDAVDALLAKHRVVFEEKGYMSDVLPVLVQYAFHAKSYKKSIQFLVRLEKIRPLNMGDMSILAWSYYHLNKFSKAASSFENLYKLKPDEDVARGLYYSLLRLGDKDRMQDLANKLGGSFAGFVEREKSRKLYSQHQFLAAHAKTDLYSDSLRNIDKPFARLSYLDKNVPGAVPVATSNFSRMHLQKVILEGRDVLDKTHELTVNVEYVKLDGSEKNLLAGAEVGTLTAGVYVKPKLQTVYKGLEWSLGYRHEGSATVYAELGQLRMPQAIDKGDWKFRLGYSRNFDSRSLQVEFYRQPLRETLLSYVGMTDPYSGVQRWGQVSRNGVNISAYQALPYNFSTNINLLAEVRKGHQVKSNNHFSAYLGLPYGFATDNFDQFSFGPFIRGEHYTMDQNHFSVGHGGYYSPQYLLDVGLNVDVLTKSGKSWMLSAAGSAGHQTVRTAAVAKLPLSPLKNLAPYTLSNNGELHYNFDVAAVVALSDYVRFNAEYRESRSWSTVLNNTVPAFKDRAFMLGLTIHFEARGKELLRDDIPSYHLQPLY